MENQNLDFDELYKEYIGMVFHIAVGFVRDSYTAEDIAQEVFLKLSQNMYRIESSAHAKHWLINVTSHECINYFREKGAEEKLIENFKSDSISTDVIERQIAKWDSQMLFDQVLEKLYAKNRRWHSVIIETYFGNKTNEELSKKYRISLNALGSLQYRIRKWMKKELLKQNPDLKDFYEDIFCNEKE